MNNSEKSLSSRQLKNIAFALDACCCARVGAFGLESSRVDDILERLDAHKSHKFMQIVSNVVSAANEVIAARRAKEAAPQPLRAPSDVETKDD